MIALEGRAVRAWRAFALGAGLLTMSAAAAMGESGSPRAFVEAIYRPYLNKDYRGAPLAKPADIRRYFEPKLAGAIIKDRAAAAKRNEPPTLNGDPFVDAQDWEVDNLAVAVKNAGPNKAQATVQFSNLGALRTVTLDLVKIGAGWRIAEIKAPSGSLRELFKLK